MRTGLRKIALVVCLAACGAPVMQKGTKSAGSNSESAITAEEIAKVGQSDTYTTVQVLRPSWLQLHGRTSFGHQPPIQVYVDDNHVDGLDYLRQVPSASVASIRHMDENEATNRYGLDHGAGAILVYTKRCN